MTQTAIGKVAAAIYGEIAPTDTSFLWGKQLDAIGNPQLVQFLYHDGTNWLPLKGSEFFKDPVLGQLGTPPVSPSNNDRYLVSASGTTGAFIGHENAIAVWDTNSTSWLFTSVSAGDYLYKSDDEVYVLFNGTIWMTQSKTTEEYFDIAGGTGVKLKSAGGGLEVRDLADASYLPITVQSVTIAGPDGFWLDTSKTTLNYPATGANDFIGVDGITNAIDLSGQDLAETFDFIGFNAVTVGRSSTGDANFLRLQKDANDTFKVDVDGNITIADSSYIGSNTLPQAIRVTASTLDIAANTIFTGAVFRGNIDGAIYFSGSSAITGYSFRGDTDSAFLWNSADDVGIYTGGIEALNIDASQIVTFTAPTIYVTNGAHIRNADVIATSIQYGAAIAINASTEVRSYAATGYGHKFHINNVIQWEIDSSGDLTGSTGNNLSVDGNITTTGDYLLSSIDRTSQGISESPYLTWSATTEEADTTDHRIDWRINVVPTNEEGTGSNLVIQDQLDGGGYVDTFIIKQDGDILLASSSPKISIVGAGSGTGILFLTDELDTRYGTQTFRNSAAVKQFEINATNHIFYSGDGTSPILTIKRDTQNSVFIESDNTLNLLNIGTTSHGLSVSTSGTNDLNIVGPAPNLTSSDYSIRMSLGAVSGGNLTYTTGHGAHLGFISNYVPTSGTGTFSVLEINPTINQNATATGITRGLSINPTLTDAADWRAIDVMESGVSKFIVGQDGIITMGASTIKENISGSLQFQNTWKITSTSLFAPTQGGALIVNGANMAYGFVGHASTGLDWTTGDAFRIMTANVEVMSFSDTQDVVIPNGTLTLYNKADPDPTGANGMMYYNSTNNKFRAFENSVWVDMIGAGGGGTIGGSITDNQIAVGATTADDIEGSSNFTFDGSTFSVDNGTGNSFSYSFGTNSMLFTTDANSAIFTIQNTGITASPNGRAQLILKTTNANPTGDLLISFDDVGRTDYWAMGYANTAQEFRINYSATTPISDLDSVGTTYLKISQGGDLTLFDGGDLIIGTATGTKIGTGTTQKLAFWNATPVVQPVHIADATDAATAISQLNLLLAQMATTGMQAAS